MHRLTEQFLLAVRRNRLDCRALKRFQHGPSLWESDAYQARITACRSLQPISSACKGYLTSSAKARQQWQLEMELHQFEQQPLP